MCIWVNTGATYSTECNQSFPVDGYRGEYCRSCSTLITERRQGMTPGPFETVILNKSRREVLSDSEAVAQFYGQDSEANARAFTKLPEIIEAGRSWLDCRNGFASTAETAATRFRELLDEAEGVL